MKSILISGFCLVAMSAAHEAGAQRTKQWLEEPTSFLGITLGAALDSVMPECERESSGIGMRPNYKYRPFASKSPCYELAYVEGAVELDMPSSVKVIHPGLFATIQDGRIASLQGKGMRYDFEDLKEILIAKYGKPHRTSVVEVVTRVGGRFESERLIWESRNILIQAEERSGQIDMFGISIHYKPLEAATERDRSDKARRAAQKL